MQIHIRLESNAYPALSLRTLIRHVFRGVLFTVRQYAFSNILAALKVKAVHLQKLLARQLVYLSGGMDGSHPILTFSASSREDTCQTSDSEITRLLIYFMELTGLAI